jgi:hypothetical protein
VTAGRLALACAFSCAFARAAHANNPEEPEDAPRAGTGLTFLDHGGTGPFWFSAQANSIFQYHPEFPAAYSGKNSLRPDAEAALSGLLTVYLAYAPLATTELIVDPEMALGGGLSDALGVAGFPNLDVVRNPTLSHAPYLGRVQLHQIIPLSSEWERNDDRGPISSFVRVPRHRLELRVGKLSTADLFDINPSASDSHLQFMNWTVDNNGAFDYAADTRGYTYGLVVEYQGPRLEVRFGAMLMPKVANGIDLDFHIAKNRAENLEVEIKYSRQPGWFGTARLLAYRNLANMGSYRETIDAALAAGLVRHRAPARLPQPGQHGQLPRDSRRRAGRGHDTRRDVLAPGRTQQERLRCERDPGGDAARPHVRARRLERRPQRELRVHRGRRHRLDRR